MVLYRRYPSDNATTEESNAAPTCGGCDPQPSLMGADEVGTLTSLKLHRRVMVHSGISEHHGRIVTVTGCWWNSPASSMQSVARSRFSAAWSGAMLIFPQRSKSCFESELTLGTSSLMATIYLAMVSISRPSGNALQPGGVCISRAANDQIRDKLSMAFADLGEQAVKNISRAVGVFGLTARISRRFRNQPFPLSAENTPTPAIRYGTGNILVQNPGRRAACQRPNRPRSPLVKTGHWMTHIEFDLESPIWRNGTYQELSLAIIPSSDTTLEEKRLSDREVPDITFEKFVGTTSKPLSMPQALIDSPSSAFANNVVSIAYPADIRNAFRIWFFSEVLPSAGGSVWYRGGEGSRRSDAHPHAHRMGHKNPGVQTNVHIQFIPGAAN